MNGSFQVCHLNWNPWITHLLLNILQRYVCCFWALRLSAWCFGPSVFRDHRLNGEKVFNTVSWRIFLDKERQRGRDGNRRLFSDLFDLITKANLNLSCMFCVILLQQRPVCICAFVHICWDETRVVRYVCQLALSLALMVEGRCEMLFVWGGGIKHTTPFLTLPYSHTHPKHPNPQTLTSPTLSPC